MTGETILKAARPPKTEPIQPSKRMMTAMERDAEAKIARALNRMRLDLLRGLTADNVQTLANRLTQREILQPFNDVIVAVLQDIALAGSDFGQEQIQRQIFGTRKATPFPVDINWELAHADAEEWAREYGAQLVQGVTNTTQQRVQKEVSAWIRNGEPLSELKRKLSAPSGPFSASRARTIAVTETTRAFAEGNTAAWIESGVVEKRQWSTAVDEVVCPICGPLHNALAKLGEPFNEGTGSYQNPPAHPNCRCGILPVIFEDTEVLETGLEQFGLEATDTGHQDISVSFDVINGALPSMEGSYNLERANAGTGSVSADRQAEIEKSYNAALSRYSSKGFDLDNSVLNIINDPDDDGFAQYLGSTTDGRHVVRINDNGRKLFTDGGIFKENIESATNDTLPMYVAKNDEEMFVHELAHAIMPTRGDVRQELNDAYSDFIDAGLPWEEVVSMYAEESAGELFAETVTALMVDGAYMPKRDSKYINVIRSFLGLI